MDKSAAHLEGRHARRHKGNSGRSAEDAQGEPFLPGPTFAGTYGFQGEPGTAAYTYGRYHNPTWTRYEDALGELEGGRSLVFSSGMAAVTAVFSSVLTGGAAGKVLVLPSDGYYTARMLAEGYLAPLGVEVRKAPTADNAQAAVLDGATLLWLETPSNPGLDACDIAELASEARRRARWVAVDNTTATPLGQRPLELGADFSVSSDSKGLTGHSDLVLGHVSVRDQAWADRLLAFRTQQGAVPGPMEVWLAHRSLATLELRIQRQCENARPGRPVSLFEVRGKIREVPGLTAGSFSRHRFKADELLRSDRELRPG